MPLLAAKASFALESWGLGRNPGLQCQGSPGINRILKDTVDG